MKALLPFLMIPLMGVSGWQLAGWYTPPPSPELPVIGALEKPPALGVTAPYPKDHQAVRVRMDALLPPQERVKTAAAAPMAAPRSTQAFPTVTAILIHGDLRAVQVGGSALAVGDGVGDFRVAAIETEQVLFENTVLRQLRWVPVSVR
jgi:hypothetical protein